MGFFLALSSDGGRDIKELFPSKIAGIPTWAFRGRKGGRKEDGLKMNCLFDITALVFPLKIRSRKEKMEKK